MIERKVGFVGAGMMAEALAQGMVHSGVIKAANLTASDPSDERRRVFEDRIGAQVLADNKEVVKRSEVVVLVVKPAVVSVVADDIASAITSKHLVILIAAGVPLGFVENRLKTNRIVRVMPNTPALVGAGASAFCKGGGVDEADLRLVHEMMSSVGLCVEVEEKLMDAVTGLSGCGPAYGYLVIEALSDGGVKMGLPRAVATRLAAQTLLGAAKMVLETGRHPADLKDQVTTPGGATIEGVHVLDKASVRGAFMDAVAAATAKCSAIAAKPAERGK